METQNHGVTNKYWMSLEQWRNDPEFARLVENEFRSSPLQSEDGKDGWARREFLKLMGASLALTTFGCVRRPAQKIIPYAKKPVEVTHGIPNFYASAYSEGYESIGILVTTRDGRPIKIEGNPDHPGNQGGTSARAIAHILKLYDPDRFTNAKRNLQNATRTNRETVNVSWENVDKAVVEQLKKGKVAMLMGTQISPSTQALIEDFAGATNATLYNYDDLSHSSFLEAQKVCYGQKALPRYRIDRAKYIVAINNDFLGTWLTPTHFNRQFAEGRRAMPEMNKLVVFESLMSLTGTNADRRFRIRPSQSLDVVMALLHEIIVVKKVSRYASDGAVLRMLSAFARNGGDLGVDVTGVADELIKNRGQSLVLAGGLPAETENAMSLYIATNFLNAVLDNEGKTVEPAAVEAWGTQRGISELVTALKNKEIKTLIIHGCNPLYSLPRSAGLEENLKDVEMIIYTGDRNDETGRLCDYIACDHHPLENWGDSRSLDGVVSVQQPTIEPLHNTRAMQDSLLSWMKGLGKGSARARGSETWYDYLRSNWSDNLARNTGGKSFDDYWVNLLQVGVRETPERSGGGRGFVTSALARVKPSQAQSGFELVLYETVGLGDGSLANVPWLQEFPDPVTKIVWDNYACFSLRDAKQFKIREGQNVTLMVGDHTVTVPAHIQPGQADGVIGLAVGYGRKGAGKVAEGVGVNAYGLAAWKDSRLISSGLETKLTVEKTFVELACTQGHHTMEGRQIVIEETLADHIKKPGGAIHHHPDLTMWKEIEYKGNKWGMVVDLNSCTGCGACVIACQSENNIPVVGKKYVLRGREMHWLRIDRYYTGTPEDPDTVHQPVPCMHCDNAPCETVCPVIATVHSDEGTNDMIYNRCVGTRYCSNNCPYKVRRFNWFDYTEIQKPRHLALNPDVTVRHRGVMEKCTFCIHRIRFHKTQAKLEDRELRADEFTTACAQACPSKAIIFGDLNNSESKVSGEFKKPHAYALLGELNTKPAVHYQVKVRNTEELKGESKHHEKGHHS